MQTEYMTIYETDYAIVKSYFRKKMTFEVAEKLGKEYCETHNYKYIGTKTADN
jgi:hypothetical protein